MLNFAPFKAMSLRKGSDITKKISRIHFKISNNNKKKKEIYGKKTHDVYCLRLP